MLADLATQFFIQVALILVVCRGLAALAPRLGQPPVVGEMLAGVLLGPSLLGLVLPRAHAWLFPQATVPVLFVIGQVGLALYMALMGLEFDTRLLRERWRSALSVALAGMLTPFALGAVLASVLMPRFPLFTAGTRPIEAVVFLGAALSITAFPMLARIIHERGLAGTSLGTLALTAGAIGDAAAWGALAVVLGLSANDATVFLRTAGGGVLFLLVAIPGARGLLALLARRAARTGDPADTSLALALAVVLLGAWATGAAGLHVVFGAFLVGVVTPRGPLANRLRERLAPFVMAFLLPLFFAYSGLHTRLALLSGGGLVMVAVVLLVAACVGKGIACWLAARLHGMPPAEALAVGALMNARGLMELLILNVGLERGLITPTLFTLMVFVALVTTLMATPAFEWACRRQRRSDGPARGTAAGGTVVLP